MRRAPDEETTKEHPKEREFIAVVVVVVLEASPFKATQRHFWELGLSPPQNLDFSVSFKK